MHRTRNQSKRTSPSKENDGPPKKVANLKVNDDDSSSESDLDDYLQKPEELDLKSSFFTVTKPDTFESIEKNILSGCNTLSESESDGEREEEDNAETSKLHFQKFLEYTKKMEEAKKYAMEYEVKKQETETRIDVSSLLASGEKIGVGNSDSQAGGNSSDFETMSESEKEDWEEIEVSESTERSVVPKEGVEITVELPNTMRQKKKGVDLIACMKRRINRVKKEHQVLIHKVHLLCWVAHGNFINSILNNEKYLGLALSLLPSQQSYPPDRPDLNYLEQILQWYHKTVNLVENNKKINSKLSKTIAEQLEEQLSKKEANSKSMFVYIFICILRALGMQCRLVISLTVQPIKPPSNELYSLSTKVEDTKKASSSKTSKIKTESTDNGQSQVDKNAEKKDDKNAKMQKQTKTVDSKKTTKESNSKSKTRATKYTEKKDNKNANLQKQKTAADSKKTTEESNSKSKIQATKDTEKKDVKNAKLQIQKKSVDSKDKTKESPGLANKTKIKRGASQEQTKVGTKSKINEVKQVSTETTRRQSSIAENVPEKQPSKRKTKSEPAQKAAGDSTRSTRLSLRKLNESIDKKEATRNLRKTERKSVSKNIKDKIPQLDGNNDSDNDSRSSTSKPNLSKLKLPEKNACAVRNHPKRLKTVPKYVDSEDDFDPAEKVSPNKVNFKNLKGKKTVSFKPTPPKQLDVKNDVMNLVKGMISEHRHKSTSSKKTRKRADSNSDYYVEPIKKKRHDSDDEFIASLKPKVKKRVQVKREIDRRVLSSDSDGGTKSIKTKKGVDIWVEVFLDAEEKWISADVVKKQVHCIKELYSRASHPVTYILSWDNNSRIKDISQRYCPNWHTVTRKMRVDPKWWEDSLKPFIGKKTARDKEEDEDLQQQQLEQPLPTTITEYKNHPLYALRRHLLKFEGIYPPDIVPIGYVRKEPVYPRFCVHTLHSREIWVKHAKVVKPGETPYKVVKARPKYDRLSNTIITDQPLEIFGPWQVEDYVPPTAENGVVPRNAYGNVELFKACMLPKGTVHLQLPSLNKVARKMNIDCAPAVVGFDFHSGWSHPTFDGFVVCEEYADVLVAAWHQEQEEAEKRAQEKLEKRVYDNWKRLIKGLLIRERLKARYDFGESSTSGSGGKRKKKKAGLVVKKRRICSDAESDFE